MESTDFRLIPLSGIRGMGHAAIVDARDYSFLVRWKWHKAVDGYAAANITFARGDKRKVPMHRLLLGTPIRGLVTDHINRDRLDNRRSNLRVVDRSTNNANSSPRSPRSSTPRDLPKGAYVWVTPHGTWVAAIRVSPSRTRHLGTYKTRSAARAVALAASM